MGKIIRELLVLLWKFLRTVGWAWLRGILLKVAIWSTVIVATVFFLAMLFGSCAGSAAPHS